MSLSKAVIILSGGMDSGVLLAESLADYRQISALSFDYGSKHNARELPFAAALCKRYNVEHRTVALPFLTELFKSSLLKGGEEIPDGSYNTTNMRSTVVPFRNGIMLAIAIGYAENQLADTVLLGSHGGDHAIYPDCRPEFTEAMSAAAEAGTYNGVLVLAPYSNVTKQEIAARGRAIDFDFSLTWTCYKGLEKHCGTCAACNERKLALGHSVGTDPTLYIA
jgi:7-cyano-7-deazaguanine synthase